MQRDDYLSLTNSLTNEAKEGEERMSLPVREGMFRPQELFVPEMQYNALGRSHDSNGVLPY